MERDRAQQDDERRRARQEAGGDAHPEQPAAAVVVLVLVRVVVVVMVMVAPRPAQPTREDARSDGHHEHARGEREPRIQALVDVMQQLLEANGARTELETALVDLDRNVDVADALARAREAYGERRSIEAEDVLAWALYRNGRCEEALGHAHRALRLGTRDALKLFHRGMIEGCLGRLGAAKATFRAALDINPHFSPRWSPVAKEAVR